MTPLWQFLYTVTLAVDLLLVRIRTALSAATFRLQEANRQARLKAASHLEQPWLRHRAFRHWTQVQTPFLDKVQRFYDAAFNQPARSLQHPASALVGGDNGLRTVGVVTFTVPLSDGLAPDHYAVNWKEVK